MDFDTAIENIDENKDAFIVIFYVKIKWILDLMSNVFQIMP